MENKEWGKGDVSDDDNTEPFSNGLQRYIKIRLFSFLKLNVSLSHICHSANSASLAFDLGSFSFSTKMENDSVVFVKCSSMYNWFLDVA